MVNVTVALKTFDNINEIIEELSHLGFEYDEEFGYMEIIGDPSIRVILIGRMPKEKTRLAEMMVEGVSYIHHEDLY